MTYIDFAREHLGEARFGGPPRGAFSLSCRTVIRERFSGIGRAARFTPLG